MTRPAPEPQLGSQAIRSTSDRSPVVPVLLVALTALVALLSWAFASPVGASPDDNFHMTSTWCAQGVSPGICEVGEKEGELLVPSDVALSSWCYATNAEQSGYCDLGENGMTATGHGNFDGLYPPVYYSTMSMFVGNNVDTSVLLMRTFNALLSVALVSTLYLLIGRHLRAPLLWGLLLTVVPMGMFLIPSVNPSGWAIVSAGTLWVALLGYFQAPTRWHRIGLAVLTIVSAVMGAGARGDSAVFVAFGALIACVLSFEKTRRWWKLALLPAAVIGIGATFYVSSGQVDSALNGEMAGDGPQSVDLIGGFARTLVQIQGLWTGNFGLQPLGWGDTTMPALVWVTTMTLFAGIIFRGAGHGMRGRKAIAVALTTLALIFVPSWVIVQNGVAVGEIVQPRYILPLMVIFAGLVLIGYPRNDLALTKLQLWATILGLAAANSLALYVNLRRYLTGIDYSGVNLDADIEWWWSLPVTPNVVWLLGSAAFGLLLVLGTGAHRRASTSKAI